MKSGRATGSVSDNGKPADLYLTRTKALEQLSQLAHAPSVGMHEVPRESLGAHLNFQRRHDNEEARDSLDNQLARKALPYRCTITFIPIHIISTKNTPDLSMTSRSLRKHKTRT